MEILYQSASLKKTILSDRIQFAVAALSLVIGYLDTLSNYNGWMIILPILGFVIAASNGIVIIFYNKIKEKFGRYFEIQVFRLNGALLLLTALGYHFEGKHTIQYVYYLLAIVYFILLPRIVLKFRARMNLIIDDKGIDDSKSIKKPIKYLWENITRVFIDEEKIKLTLENNKTKVFFFSDNNQETIRNLKSYIETLNSKNKFELVVKE